MDTQADRAYPDRDLTIDVAKGFAIVLVVFGHALQYSFGPVWASSQAFYQNVIFKTIYSFHMPLFMLISGYLFYGSNQKDFKTLAVSKLKGIGIPMVTFVLLCNVLSHIKMWVKLDFIHSLISLVGQVFHGMTMWFLLSLLLNILIVSVITRVCKNRRICYVFFVLFFIVSLFIPDSIVLSVHKFMFPFFCIGYVVKQRIKDIYKYSHNTLFMIGITILSILSIVWFDYDTYIYTSGFCILNDYGNQLIIDCKRTLIAICVSILVIQFVHLIIENHPSIYLAQLGRMSLLIYGINIFIDIVYTRVFSMKGWNLSFNYLTPVLFTMGVILISVLFYKLVSTNRVTSLLFLGK